MSGDLLRRTADAINAVYKTFGRPGDYGYDTPKGDALKRLYDTHNEIERALAGPWWQGARAETPGQAAEFCKKLGTGQCAAICLSHSSIHTTNGACPEASRVWMKS